MRLATIIFLASLATATSASAMTPADLSAQELRAYNAVKTNPVEAKSYLDTREYFHACLRVKTKELAAKDLPAAPDDYDERYVTNDEKAIVDESTYAWIILRLDSSK